jgi:hypothetical protein
MVIIPRMLSLLSKNVLIFSIAIIIVSGMNNDPTGVLRSEVKSSSFFYPLLLILTPVIISKIPVNGVGSLMNTGIPLLSSIVTATVAYFIQKTTNKTSYIKSGTGLSKQIHTTNEIDIKGFKIDTSHSYIIAVPLLVDLIIQIVLFMLLR